MSISRYYRTVRHLKPSQLFWRLWRKAYRPKPDLAPAPPLRERAGVWEKPIAKQTRVKEPDTFTFLNETRRVDGPGAWNDPRIGRLWLYNLHYFDYLNTGPERGGWRESIIRRWISENPPAEGVGWEPYPASLRIVNWIKWALAGGSFDETIRRSLAIQARWLTRNMERDILANHLFANAKALVFAGLFFDGAEAEAWRSMGAAMIDSQLDEQVLSDGGHFERSPMYHAIVLEDTLDLINITRAYLCDAPAGWSEKALKMVAWLGVMTHPDGKISFFNDSAFDIAPGLEVLEDYAARLGVDTGRRAEKGFVHLRDSGYIRIEKGPATAIIDAAPVGPDCQPGHAHADTLSFELSINGRRVMVNSGTSTYEPGPERLAQRGTAAHNTVRIDRADSTEVWGAFRVARRARIVDMSVENAGDETVVLGAHDGFVRLAGVGAHKRVFRMSEGALLITDEIAGSGDHDVEIFFHLHPDIAAGREGNNVARLAWDGGAFRADVRMDERLALSLEEDRYHPGFGLSVPNTTLAGRARIRLPLTLMTKITWR